MALGLSFCVTNAQNYFVEGIRWETEVWGSHAPTETAYETVYLEGTVTVDGKDCLKMWRMTDNDPATTCQATVIYVDGDKVYFLPNTTTNEWTLLYDFGLNEGEGCTIGFVPYPWTETSQAITTYVKSTGVSTCDDNDSLEVMALEEYGDASCSLYLGAGKWLKGLGALNGVLNNGYFEADGMRSKLLSVTLNGTEIYKSSEAGIHDVQEGENAETFEHRKYGLDGRPFDDTSSAGIYIKGGKKFLNRK